MGRGAWRATVNEVTQSWTLLSYKHFYFLVDMSSMTVTSQKISGLQRLMAWVFI